MFRRRAQRIVGPRGLEVLEEEAARGRGQMSGGRADLGGVDLGSVGVIAGEWRIFFWEEFGCEGRALRRLQLVGGVQMS